ncbi:MAG: calcium-binding protein [Hyphomonadaceae bacterium]
MIVGNIGADTLDGGGGADFMVGGAGDDLYFVDNIGDVVIENAGEGTADVIYTSLAFYSVGDTDVEQISITSTAGSYIIGNALANLIVGNSGADTLEGRAGADVLVGNDGADNFLYNNASEGGDVVTDFVPGEDHFRFSATGFGSGLVNGGPAPFVSGSDPTSVGASFLYDTDDGRLFWDSDGVGGAAPIHIATLQERPQPSHKPISSSGP